jgi:hypothetical protein
VCDVRIDLWHDVVVTALFPPDECSIFRRAPHNYCIFYCPELSTTEAFSTHGHRALKKSCWNFIFCSTQYRKTETFISPNIFYRLEGNFHQRARADKNYPNFHRRSRRKLRYLTKSHPRPAYHSDSQICRRFHVSAYPYVTFVQISAPAKTCSSALPSSTSSSTPLPATILRARPATCLLRAQAGDSPPVCPGR